MADKDPAQARLRLIDHFKRIYTIVIGLAITEAVRRLFPIAPEQPPTAALWMFGTFFITLVPIFHGGDRSLDFKYSSSEQNTLSSKASYLWDVYMLLITAILFVCIAETIPSRSSLPANLGAYPNAGMFYFFMAVMLGFDVVVLLIDRIKSSINNNLKIYVAWIVANILLCCICAYAAYRIGLSTAPHASDSFSFLFVDLTFKTTTLIIFIFALFRTVADYIADHFYEGKFLFP